MNLTTSGRLLALLDSLAEFPPSAMLLQFHDYDGTLIATLQIWAGGRAMRVDRHEHEDRRDSYHLVFSESCTIIVHDGRRAYGPFVALTAAGVLQPPVKLEPASDKSWSAAQHVRVA